MSIPADVQHMVDNEGVYVCGSHGHADKCTVIWSKAGMLWSTCLDETLDPRRFRDDRIINGPYWADPEKQI